MPNNIRIIAILLFSFLLILTSCGVPFQKPPDNLNGSNLVGTWEAHYDRDRIDKIIIRGDGTFKQVYQGHRSGYSFEIPWSHWELEKDREGNVLIHLIDGRYYVAGNEIGEREGWHPPCPPDLLDCSGWENLPDYFYDPFADKLIEMTNELILSVRSQGSGDVLLHHMWLSSDGGFALIGGEVEIFRRVEE